MPATESRMLTRRRFLTGGAMAAGAAVGVAGYSTLVARHLISTERVTVAIRNLPAAFHGFTIAQLSDFHFHDFDEPWLVEHAVKLVNDVRPDMVALTGDFVTAHRVQGPKDLPTALNDANECAEILAGIRCDLRYCSLGNHDSVAPAAIAEALDHHGLTTLRNSYTALDRGGDRMWLGGLADAYFDVPHIDKAVPVAKEGEPVILLGHEPDFADTVAEFRPVDLMLSGHTHGGQVRLPFLPAMFLPAMGVKYVSGLFPMPRAMQLYVNRGLGCMHLPFRLNCPPELTVITLQPA